jgi:hypothetical protein
MKKAHQRGAFFILPAPLIPKTRKLYEVQPVPEVAA